MKDRFSLKFEGKRKSIMSNLAYHQQKKIFLKIHNKKKKVINLIFFGKIPLKISNFNILYLRHGDSINIFIALIIKFFSEKRKFKMYALLTCMVSKN